MLAAGVDHLWQSLQFSGVACVLAWLARGNAAIVRLWLFRMAALKFLALFHLVFAIGAVVRLSRDILVRSSACGRRRDRRRR